ncbi:MAG: Holliday junction branch migration protein RuvA [Methanocalculus sp. MSAO_Arc1]|uniref:Holliday junction branch migration protein RuvA n=1 Tax=Methanocalculus TaxID=71151 RepID=UPI000FF02B62|nr:MULTISPECIES: Holliday junction branch migration protein RuvA [unclassified Methanocalculus]MCP1661485.1 Holliday junction DNA helicase RuvA [Methanocalculus sp. AMF5]RQD79760.1 MAG: Holliday junction branch migration protein RuvA [Methanocalculus sp. MSAO_Arc1]
MFAHITGRLTDVGEKSVVLDVGGIGYLLQVSQPTLRELEAADGPVKVFTQLVVREDALTLYGFHRQSERELFQILINVSGIGPQIALSILSQISLEQFAMAIINDDERALTSISGIGPKSAKRLILELQETMKKQTISLIDREEHLPASDAKSALVSLGFTEREAEEAVKAVIESVPGGSVQAIIKAALRHMKERGS